MSKKIAEGDFIARVKVTGNDELSDLSTDINAMAQKLQESDTNARQISDVLDESAAVSITDADGTITYANKKFCDMSKYSREELLGQNHRILKSGFHPPEFYEDMWKTIFSGQIWKGEVKNKAKNGLFYWVKTVIAPFYDDADKKHPIKYISIRIDITEQKELQEKTSNAERLSTIGELSARIAHDLRNPLSIIKNSLAIMKETETNMTERSVKNIARMERSISRMTHQIDDVLEYVRPKSLVFKKMSVLKIFESTLDRLDVPSTVKIILPSNDVDVIADLGKLEVVFANLITNAIQAMTNIGTITITAAKSEESVIIEVQDMGHGIPDDLLPQIFDPLFTTRQIGTGLGLPSCKAIVEKHHGTINVRTVLGKGTTFIVKLPRLGLVW